MQVRGHQSFGGPGLNDAVRHKLMTNEVQGNEVQSEPRRRDSRRVNGGFDALNSLPGPERFA